MHVKQGPAHFCRWTSSGLGCYFGISHPCTSFRRGNFLERLSILESGLVVIAKLDQIPATLQIIPQALCSRYGLSVGAKFSFLVRLLVLVLLPISYPISKVIFIYIYIYQEKDSYCLLQ